MPDLSSMGMDAGGDEGDEEEDDDMPELEGAPEGKAAAADKA